MLPVMRTDEFSRCDERIQLRESGKSPSPMARSDASLKESVERAIWKDDVLRAIEYYEIDVRAKNGIVHLNGHITNSTSRIRIENAIRSVPGILGTRNRLILDDKIILEVAASLATLEHIYGCKFFTGASHGVVSLGGIVSDDNIKSLAEKCVASNPNVRAVINHIRVAGVVLELPDPPFLQPTIAELIYFLDGVSGVVKQVIMNPNNRRVVAMTVWGQFADQRREPKFLNHGEVHQPPERLVVIPMDVIRYLTRDSGFLHIKSDETERYKDFDPASFFTPTVDWTPPYPYCPADVLFPVEYQIEEIQLANQPHPFEELLQGVSFKEQFFARDTPES
jgi:osmotically-inducible protein OsmY